VVGASSSFMRLGLYLSSLRLDLTDIAKATKPERDHHALLQIQAVPFCEGQRKVD